MRLNSLIRYPLKSCRAQPLHQSHVGPRGLEYDRRWMVIDAAGRFITARKTPSLLGITAIPRMDGTLRLTAQGQGPCLACVTDPSDLITSTVWGDECTATHVQGADQWLSTLLDQPARLVYMHDTLHRPVNPVHAQPGDIVSFADGYPLLVAGQSSLDDLNTRLAQPVTMARFRPNLVIEGTEPYEEYKWQRIRVGELEFACAGPCVRCVMTTRDPDTGKTDGSTEPLKTLSTYLRNDKGPIFGVNFIPRTTGMITVGQTVEVLELK